MKDASMSLGIYFEIKDAELYGGEGTTGYAGTNMMESHGTMTWMR